MTKFKLISFALCPYVQRAAIVLAEKGIAFERIDIDLANKPAWFLKLSPLGKVPVLVVEQGGREEVLFESAVIAEYLDETIAPQLHPADPLEKARHRAWIEFASALLADLYGYYTAADEQGFAAKRKDIETKLFRLEEQLEDGPFFSGGRFGLVDASFAPAFRYFQLFDRITGDPLLAGKPKVQAFAGALLERTSVRGAVAPDYLERLREFVRQKGGHLASLDRAEAA